MNLTGKRIFMPLESVTIAHVVRPLQVAKALRYRGTEVIFGVSEKYQPFLKNEGFEVIPMFSGDPQILLEAVRTVDFSKQSQYLPQYLESDLQAIRAVEPIDAIVSDFRFTIRFAAEHLGIPHIALTNGYYSPYYDVVPEMPGVIATRMPKWLAKNLFFRKAVKTIVHLCMIWEEKA